MSMNSLKSLVFLSLLFSMFLSCVPTKKFEAVQAENYSNKKAKDSLAQIVDDTRYLKFEVQRLESQLKKIEKEKTDIEERYQAFQQNNQDLLYRYDQLLAQNKALLATTSDEKQSLTEELAVKQIELDQKERELKRIADDLASKEAIFKNDSDKFNEYEKRVQELEAALQLQQSKLAAIRQKVNQALLGFSDSDLSVSEKNGKIYVSLSQNLLFATGSDNIDWNGKKAIIQVASVLKGNPDINVNVEGHTDSTGSADKNWDLSVRRATAVVNVLVGQGVDPKRVTASGRALYDPVASNVNAEGRAKNRRTEIILTPKLDQLYQIINQ